MAIEIFARHAVTPNRAWAGLGLTVVQLELGADVDAEKTLDEAFHVAQSAGMQRFLAWVLCTRALIYLRRGEPYKAKNAILHLLDSSVVLSYTHLECEARIVLARSLLALNDQVLAEVEARKALGIAREAPTSRCKYLVILAEIRLAQGDIADAKALLDEARHSADAMGGLGYGEGHMNLLCAEVLRAAGLGETGRQAALFAKKRLLARAERIKDPATRRRFLENIPDHRRTLELAREWLKDEASNM